MRIDQLADPDVDVDVLLDQVDDAIRQQQVDLDLRILGEKRRECGHDVQMPDQHPRMNAQRASWHGLQLRNAVVGLRDLMEYLLDLGEVELAGFGERELTAGAVDQTTAETRLQSADVAGHRRRRQTELTPGRGQAAVLDDADEYAHRLQ